MGADGLRSMAGRWRGRCGGGRLDLGGDRLDLVLFGCRPDLGPFLALCATKRLSMQMSRALVRVYRVLTEGRARPSSICEMLLAEMSSWRGSSRTRSLRWSRAARKWLPMSSCALVLVSGATSPGASTVGSGTDGARFVPAITSECRGLGSRTWG
jgi:hypothetical protein